MSNPEAKSGAEVLFRGVEGIEDFADQFGRNAKAGVNQTDSHSRMRSSLAAADWREEKPLKNGRGGGI